MLRNIFCLLLGLGTTFGGLAWERPLQEFHAIPEDGFVETTFTFKNTGGSPVRIRKVQSSCGCTTTKLDKRDFAPGETGELKAKFTFRGRRGAQRKTIQVITDDGTETVLDFRVWIHEPLRIKPALVYWKIGDPTAPKTVELTAGDGQEIKITSVSSSNPSVRTEVETVTPGTSYRLVVRPTSTAERQTGEVKVVTDSPPSAPRTYLVHVRIK